MAQEKPEKKETTDERYNLVEVPTETGIFIKDNESEKILDDKAVLVEILNTLSIIKKAVA